MAKSITLYKIFVASPSDLKEERNIIEEVVNELNLSTYNNSDVKIELVKWETHSNPGIGEYPQQIINNDIGKDYDIFVGILWSKFGTPTKNFGSGTEEEFYNAYSLYKKNPSTSKIMFYFKKTAVPFDKIDPESINSIRKFKKELGEIGVLHWEYDTKEEFQKFMRIHISRKIQDLRNSKGFLYIKTENTHFKKEEYDENGLFDYLEIGEESFKYINEILFKMTDSIEWISNQFIALTNEIKLHISYNPQMGNKTKKKLVNSAANDLKIFNNRLNSEILDFSITFQKGINSYSNALKISLDLKAEEENEIKSTINSINTLIIILQNSNKNSEIFRESLVNLPRLSKELNHAKSISSDILKSLKNEFETANNLLTALKFELESSLKNL